MSRAFTDASDAGLAVSHADAFLSNASELLASSTDYPGTFERIANLAVPFLADWCAIDVVDPGTKAFQRVAVAHIEAEKAKLGFEIQRRFPAAADLDTGYPKVLRTGVSLFVREVPDANLALAAQSPEHLVLLRKLGFHSYMCTPLIARGRTLGTMSFVSSSALRFTPGDLAVAEELARRAALALDNARLLHFAEEARRRAAMLAEASRMLASCADPVAILPELLQLAIPDFGDHAAVRLLDASGRFAPAVIANADPLMLEVATVVNERWGAATDEWMMTVVRSGESVFLPVIGDDRLRAHATSEEHFAMMKKAAPRSLIVVPIKLREAVFGTLNFSLQRPGRNYEAADVALVEDLGLRIALALDNARLHASEQQAIRGRDELLSVASHEMRTPLGALQLMVRVLKNELEAGKPAKTVARDLAAKIEVADRQVSRISKIVNKLLDFSRIKAGAVFLESEDVDLSAVAREVVARFDLEAVDSGSRITLTAEAGVVGHWDLFRIEQILTNLLANAIRYGAGQPINVQVSRAGAAARLVVRDGGPGIAPEDRERIFERYVRRTQKSFAGLGLGLYIVRQILDEAGGTITVESAPGEGATFTVTIPLRPPPPH